MNFQIITVSSSLFRSSYGLSISLWSVGFERQIHMVVSVYENLVVAADLHASVLRVFYNYYFSCDDVYVFQLEELLSSSVHLNRLPLCAIFVD